MEDESTSASLMSKWLTKLTTNITSGKIVPMHYGEDLPPAVNDALRDARAVWIVRLSDSTLDIDALFANSEGRKATSLSPAQTKRRIMFPCPVHNGLDSEGQADVIRRSKMARNWGLDVRWVDHEILQSMIIVNPPIENDPDLGDGMALIDVCLPHLDTTARAKFEITQKDHEKMFSDLVRSFSHTWGKAHEPRFEKEKRERRRTVLKGWVVA